MKRTPARKMRRRTTKSNPKKQSRRTHSIIVKMGTWEETMSPSRIFVVDEIGDYLW
jgi:hypothetical protein